MKAVILQPSYIPWRGYFHQIHKADVFIFYDDVQYDKHGWRNRNRIKTHQGTQWLTIPVHARGAPVQHTPIDQVLMDFRQPWNRKHWMTLEQSYSKAPYFKRCIDWLEPLYQNPPPLLADFTLSLTIEIARQIGIQHTRFLRSSALEASGTKTDRLLHILTQVGADHYISGPSARSYLDENAFARAGITLEYMEYNYPVYEQLYPPYDPQVSILDLIFMTGPDALAYMT